MKRVIFRCLMAIFVVAIIIACSKKEKNCLCTVSGIIDGTITSVTEYVEYKGDCSDIKLSNPPAKFSDFLEGLEREGAVNIGIICQE